MISSPAKEIKSDFAVRRVYKKGYTANFICGVSFLFSIIYSAFGIRYFVFLLTMVWNKKSL